MLFVFEILSSLLFYFSWVFFLQKVPTKKKEKKAKHIIKLVYQNKEKMLSNLYIVEVCVILDTSFCL